MVDFCTEKPFLTRGCAAVQEIMKLKWNQNIGFFYDLNLKLDQVLNHWPPDGIEVNEATDGFDIFPTNNIG